MITTTCINQGEGLNLFCQCQFFPQTKLLAMNMMKRFRRKLQKDHCCGAVNQTRLGVACNVQSKSIRIPCEDREMNPTSPDIMNCKCDSPYDFNAKGESTRTTRFHFKTKEFILTRFSTLAILPHQQFLLFQRTRLRQLSVSKSNKRAC